MRTVRCSGRLSGLSARGGICLGGVTARGVYTFLPWTEFLTHACENITFPQLLLQTVNIGLIFVMYERSVYKPTTCM